MIQAPREHPRYPAGPGRAQAPVMAQTALPTNAAGPPWSLDGNAVNSDFWKS